MVTQDETAITEVTIEADGRIFLFGLSCEMLDVLASIFPNHPELMARVAQLKSRQNDPLVEKSDDPGASSIAQPAT